MLPPSQGNFTSLYTCAAGAAQYCQVLSPDFLQTPESGPSNSRNQFWFTTKVLAKQPLLEVSSGNSDLRQFLQMKFLELVVGTPLAHENWRGFFLIGPGLSGGPLSLRLSSSPFSETHCPREAFCVTVMLQAAGLGSMTSAHANVVQPRLTNTPALCPQARQKQLALSQIKKMGPHFLTISKENRLTIYKPIWGQVQNCWAALSMLEATRPFPTYLLPFVFFFPLVTHAAGFGVERPPHSSGPLTSLFWCLPFFLGRELGNLP